MLLLIIATVVKIAIVLGILLGIAPLLVVAERRQSAMVQDRIGPVRAGIPLGGKIAWDFVAGFGGLNLLGGWALLWNVALVLDVFDIGPELGDGTVLYSLVPFVGPFMLCFFVENHWAFVALAAVALALQMAGLGAILAGRFLKDTISLAEFVRGPMSLGARAVAYGCVALAVLCLGAYAYAYAVEGPIARDAAVYEASSLEEEGAPELDAQQRELLLVRIEEAVQAKEILLVGGAERFAAQMGEYRGADDAVKARWMARHRVGGAVDEAFDRAYVVWGWSFVVLLLLGLLHFVAAFAVKHAVDGRGQLVLFGALHPAVDAVKAIWKEDFTPPRADKFLYSAAPIIATIPAFATFAVIPFGPDVIIGPDGDPFAWLFRPVNGAVSGTTIPLQVASINVGILYIFAIAGTGIVGAAIAGYSSDNKYSLLGGLRAASQMVSYEVTLGLTLVGCFMVYGTLLLDRMVEWQQQHVWGFVVQPLALILFFFAAMAEMKRVPFDAPEGESEIVAGYFLEYAGMKFVMFMMGEFIEHIVASGIIVTLFFGGYDVPFLHSDGFHFDFLGLYAPVPHIVVVLIGIGAFLLKVILCCLLMVQVRWTLPRFRYDQIMQLCWKIILPLSLANILVTGIVILLLQ
jgi:NADH:ubiquinone oxidoreductase subunit H